MHKIVRLPTLSLKSKLLLSGCAIAFVTALLVGGVNYYKTSQIAMEMAIEKLAGSTRQTSIRLKSAYAQMLNDGQVIARTPPIQGIIRAQHNAGTDPLDGSTSDRWTARLSTIFASLIANRPYYTQIRYVSIADGREIVRVNHRGDAIEVVLPEGLQQKQDEPYFKDAMLLKPGQSYFSNVTLNREHGQVDPQRLATLRLVLPIYDAAGEYFGLIIINADYVGLIKSALADVEASDGIYVTDTYGDYIHRNVHGEYSSLQLASDYTEVPPALIEDLRSALNIERSLVKGDQVAYYVPVAVNPSQPTYLLGTLLYAPASEVFAGARGVLTQSLLLAVGLAGLLIAAASMTAGAVNRGVTRPISQMTQEIIALGQGRDKADLDLPVNANDAVGELARAFQELTEKLDMSQAIRLKLAVQLDAFLTNAVDAVLIVNEYGVIERANPACVAMFGYEVADLIGRNVSMLMPETMKSHHDDYIRDYRNAGERKVIGRTREEMARRRDGSLFPIALSISEIQLADRRIFTGTIRDMSVLKHQEAELRASEATLRSAMQYAPIGMALIDFSGNWLEVNNALCDLLGYSSEELKRLSFQVLTYPDDLGADLEQMRLVLAGEIDSYQMEKRYLTKSGTPVWAQLSVSIARRGDGAPQYLIKQIQDISERKEIDRLKDEFVSMVSHELRTPLTSIRGALSLIIAMMTVGLPERIRNLLEIAHKNSERLIRLINDILDMEKISAGKMAFAKGVEDFSTLARQAVEADQAYAREYGVTLKLTVPDEELPIATDRTRLMQVMSNLLSNASKFSTTGSQVEIEVERLGDRIRFSVRDHGPGIPDEFRSRVFGRFAQANSSASRAKGGNGLGLHISKQIIESMGGSIDFKSTEGEGSTFWIELPLNGADAVGGSQNRAKLSKRNPRILLLDEAGAFGSITASLIRAGFTTQTVDNEDAAIPLLHSGEFEMLVIDASGPDHDGMALLKTLRVDPTMAPIPILILPGRGGGAAFASDGGDAKLLGTVKRLITTADATEHQRSAIGVPIPGRAPEILHVEDDTDLTEMLASALRGRATLIPAPTLADAKTALAMHRFALIILDITLPDGTGLDLLDDAARLGTPVLVLSANELGEDALNVPTALVKSRLPEAQIVETILSMIGQPPLDGDQTPIVTVRKAAGG